MSSHETPTVVLSGTLGRALGKTLDRLLGRALIWALEGVVHKSLGKTLDRLLGRALVWALEGVVHKSLAWFVVTYVRNRQLVLVILTVAACDNNSCYRWL